MGAVLLDTHAVHWWSAEPERISRSARSALTPAIADTAVALPTSFPRNAADRLIYATAIEQGVKLITKDREIADHDKPRSLVVW